MRLVAVKGIGKDHAKFSPVGNNSEFDLINNCIKLYKINNASN